MNEKELIQRTKQFALNVIRFVGAMPKDIVGRTLGGQLLRAGTSVGANYRAACRGRSRAEFIAKLGNVEEEADECVYWFELIDESGLMEKTKLETLMNEAGQLTAIMAASRRTAKGQI